MSLNWAEQLFSVIEDAARAHPRSWSLGVARNGGALRIVHLSAGSESFQEMDRCLAVAPPAPGRQSLTVFSCTSEVLQEIAPTVRLADGLHRPAGSITDLDPNRWRWRTDMNRKVVYGLDLEGLRGLTVVAEAPDDSELSAPFRTHFQWLAQQRGEALIHAAMVVRAQSGVLIVGPGGAGKSTTVCSALLAGLGTLGDDYVWVQPPGATGGTFTARSVYQTVKLRPSGPAANHPAVQGLGHRSVREGQKRLHYLSPEQSVDPQQSVDISAIVVLSRGLGEGPPRQVSGSAALVAAAPSTALQGADDQQQTLAVISAMARSIPTYQVPLVASAELQGQLVEHVIARSAGALMHV